jgi:hypothetical protein
MVAGAAPGVTGVDAVVDAVRLPAAGMPVPAVLPVAPLPVPYPPVLVP